MLQNVWPFAEGFSHLDRLKKSGADSEGVKSLRGEGGRRWGVNSTADFLRKYFRIFNDGTSSFFCSKYFLNMSYFINYLFEKLLLQHSSPLAKILFSHLTITLI